MHRLSLVRMVGPNNAMYCPRDNTIYFDDVFVTANAKLAANQLHTDGDMAAVGIIAHEMGTPSRSSSATYLVTRTTTNRRRVDSRIVRRAALMGHGTRDQRMENFRRGLDGGPGACLSEFRGFAESGWFGSRSAGASAVGHSAAPLAHASFEDGCSGRAEHDA